MNKSFSQLLFHNRHNIMHSSLVNYDYETWSGEVIKYSNQILLNKFINWNGKIMNCDYSNIYFLKIPTDATNVVITYNYQLNPNQRSLYYGFVNELTDNKANNVYAIPKFRMSIETKLQSDYTYFVFCLDNQDIQNGKLTFTFS